MRSLLPALALTSGLLAACAPSQEAASPATVDPSAAPAAAGAPAAPAQAGPTTLRGTLLGAPFSAVAACLTQMREEGRAQIEIYQANNYDVATQCGHLGASPEHRVLGLEVPWQDGARLDVATHRVTPGIPAGYVVGWTKEGTFRRQVVNHDFKPTGAVEVVRAGGKKGDVGRIRLTFASGSDKLEGEIDVYVSRDVSPAR
jgi:hypothetical protein